MPDIKSTIEKLKSEFELLSERSKDIIQYLLDTGDADIEDETLSDEETEVFARQGYVVSINDIIDILESFFVELLIEKQNSAFHNLERLKSDRQNS